MKLLLPVLLTLLGQPNPGVRHLHLPPPEDGREALAVMMAGGAPPATPWQGLDAGDRELLWALGCRGAQVTRTSWAGYVLVCPAGTAEVLAELADSLAAAPTDVRASRWAETLQLSSESLPATVLMFDGRSEEPVDSLPVRTSALLSEPPDTVVVTGPWANSVVLWAHGDSARVHASYWRGVGTEAIATEGGCFSAGVCSGISGSPAGLELLLGTSHVLDSVFAAGWGSAIPLVEQAIAESRGPCSTTDHLVWLRGLEASPDRIEPWSATPMPSPSAYPERLPELPSPVASSPLPQPLPLDSGVVRIPLAPGAMDTPTSTVACVLLERLAGSLALRDFPEVSTIWLASGAETVWLEGLVEDPRQGLADSLASRLSLLALAPPSRRMVNNCSVRASFLAGRTIDPPSRVDLVREMVRLLEEG